MTRARDLAGSNFTSIGGIQLGGTGSANLLDDYEIGTFTPSMGASSGSITTQSNTGEYVKVGDVCFIYMVLTLTNKGTASGTLTVSGLPFTSGTLRSPMVSRENATTGVMEQFVVDSSGVTGFLKATGGGNVALANGNLRVIGGSYITA
jgi:hypothetical protein